MEYTQSLPKDLEPVSKWDDRDSAWLNVAKSIRGFIDEFHPPQRPLQSQLELTDTVVPKLSILEWASDTEISFSHRNVSDVSLEDVFVWPDLHCDTEEDITFDSSEDLLSKKGRYFLTGEEQQGKTTLLKRLFVEFLKISMVPIYIDAKGLNKSDLEKLVKQAIKDQYDDACLGVIHNQDKVLLIDNLGIESVGLNKIGLCNLVEKIIDDFDWVVATAHDSFTMITAEVPLLVDFKQLELQGLGHYKREEIAKKWITIGVEEVIDEKELYRKCEEVGNYLNSIIRKNILPPKPIYVLLLIQMLEASAKQSLEMTSHGHCYQKLIYEDLAKAKVRPNEIEKYLNFLTELAWNIFRRGKGLNSFERDQFFQRYNAKYLSVDGNAMVKTLSFVPILREKKNRLHFSYPYIYYFFTAKKIAESYSTSREAQEAFELLLNKFNREDFSNILVFITHHSKEKWVTTKINKVLGELFDEQEESKLTVSELAFMNEFIHEIPALVIDSIDVQCSRDLRNKELDSENRNQKSFEDPDEKDEVSKDVLVNINKTFKGMDVAGQILKNRHATLEKGVLLDLAQQGTFTGLRFLSYFIDISDTTRNEIINVVKSLLDESKYIDKAELEKHARKAYFQLIYGVINGVVRKISSSIGSSEAYEIYEELESKVNSPAISLIKQTIDLQFNRRINFEELEKTVEVLKNNPVCTHILKEIIVQHVYMFPTDYKEKQKLEELFGLSVKQQRLFDTKKKGKG